MDRHTAFRQFVDSEQRGAVALAFRLLGPQRHNAEDIAQKAFLKAWSGLHRFRNEAQVRTWFHRIVVNEVRSFQRWQNLRRRLWAPADAGERVGEDETWGDFALRARINGAMDRLSPPQREAFVLVRLEGLTVEETATVTGRAAGTIKSHLHRALKHLRAELADVYEESV